MYTDGFQGEVTWGELAVWAVCCLYFCAVVLLVGDGWTWRGAARAVVRRVLAWLGQGAALLAVPCGPQRVLAVLGALERWGRLS